MCPFRSCLRSKAGWHIRHEPTIVGFTLKDLVELSIPLDFYRSSWIELVSRHDCGLAFTVRHKFTTILWIKEKFLKIFSFSAPIFVFLTPKLTFRGWERPPKRSNKCSLRWFTTTCWHGKTRATTSTKNTTLSISHAQNRAWSSYAMARKGAWNGALRGDTILPKWNNKKQRSARVHVAQ